MSNKQHKKVPIDVMFTNDRGDCFDFSNILIKSSFMDQDWSFSFDHVMCELARMFNRKNSYGLNGIKILKLVHVGDVPYLNQPRDICLNFKSFDFSRHAINNLKKEIDQKKEELAKLEYELESIVNPEKHIKHVTSPACKQIIFLDNQKQEA